MEVEECLRTMDMPEKNLCIKCDGGGNLLVCSKNDCLLAMHEQCMGCPARFDDVGHFYCPHCFYRQALEELNRTEEDAMSKQKALSIWMSNEKSLKENDRAEAKRLNQLEDGANVNMVTCHDGKSRQGNDVIPNQSVQTDGDEQAGIHCECTEDLSSHRGADVSRLAKRHHILKSSENTKSNERDSGMNITSRQPRLEPVIAGGRAVLCCEIEGTSERFKDDKFVQAEHEEPIDSNKLSRSLQEDTHTKNSTQVQDPSISSRGKLDNIMMQEEHKISDVEEENMQEVVSQSSSASTEEEHSLNVHTRSKRRFESSDSIDTDSETLSERNKRNKASYKNKKMSQRINRPRRSSPTTIEVFDDKVDTPRRLKKSKKSVNLGNGMFDGKRKRLMWRKEEEEILKRTALPSHVLNPFLGAMFPQEGVHKFSSSGKKNIPWRKILEFGRHVFDETRAPTDLRDKWRNILGSKSSSVFRGNVHQN